MNGHHWSIFLTTKHFRSRTSADRLRHVTMTNANTQPRPHSQTDLFLEQVWTNKQVQPQQDGFLRQLLRYSFHPELSAVSGRAKSLWPRAHVKSHGRCDRHLPGIGAERPGPGSRRRHLEEAHRPSAQIPGPEPARHVPGSNSLLYELQEPVWPVICC